MSEMDPTLKEYIQRYLRVKSKGDPEDADLEELDSLWMRLTEFQQQMVDDYTLHGFPEVSGD